MNRCALRGRTGALGVCAIALALAVTGCGITRTAQPQQSSPPSGGSSATATTEGRIIQTRYSTYESPVRYDLLALGRVNAKVMALRLRVTNIAEDGYNIHPDFLSTANQGGVGGGGGKFADLALIDAKDMKAYYALPNASDGNTLCSNWPENNDDFSLPKGYSFTSTILFPAVPSYVHAVNIAAKQLEPFTNIPIAPNYQLRGDDPDPSDASDQVLIRSLTEHSDSLDKTKSIDDKGKKVDVRLNADVLFKFDKYKLTPKANGLLNDVAERIDRSKATTIHVDGYTDNKGSDSYNKKLSQRRAASVLKALKQKVTRTGIRYVSAGHGEGDPVATNDTAQGRQRNRRVTVTLGS